MEYQVPQFIEVEDKIFGPFTLKQFIYLAGGVGLSVVLLLYLPLLIGIILTIPVAGFSGALAFYKVNNKSFTDILGASLAFYTKDRLYLWKKEEKNEQARTIAPVAPLPAREKLSISSGKLKELALSLDIKDQNNPQEPI